MVIFDLERGAAPGERRTEDRLAVKLGHRSRQAGRVWVCYAGCFALALGLDGPSGFLCVLHVTELDHGLDPRSRPAGHPAGSCVSLSHVPFGIRF